MNFQRRLRRLNENSHWAPLRRIHQVSRVSMAGTLEGLQRHPAGLEPAHQAVRVGERRAESDPTAGSTATPTAAST